MNTTFAIIASFQYWENYAFTEDGYLDTDNPYWKAKGGSELVIAEGLSVSEVMSMGAEGIKKLVMDTVASSEEVANNGACQYDLLDYVVEERSEAVLVTILDRIKEIASKEEHWMDLDYGYFVYSAPEIELNEETVKWGLNILKERGVITWDDEARYSYARISLTEEELEWVA